MFRVAARIAVGIAGGVAALACVTRTFTIIPTTGTSWKRMDAIPQRREDVVLVLSRAALAPVEVTGQDGIRRRFVVGDALQAILRDYFDHAFGRVVTIETRPADADADFVVEPELSRLDVSQKWSGKYRFEVGLRARVSLPGDPEPLGTFDGLGQEATFGNEAALAIATNSALQAGAAELVGKLVRELPARAATEPGG